MISFSLERKWTIIIAIVLGLLAVVLTNVYFRQKEAQLRVATKPVLVAAKQISKGAVIDYNMLAFKVMPVKFTQPGALRARELAVGKTALVPIMPGEQILATKLAAPGAGLTLAGKTPPGKRAFTITFDPVAAVGGMVRPGDHVDVLASFSKQQIMLTLFQNVLVLAVGQQMVPTAEAEGVGKRTGTPKKSTITFALTPQEVQILTVATEHGKIQLTLRPPMESEKALPPVNLSNLPSTIDLNTLFQFYIRRPRVEIPSVEVIRGLKKEIMPLPR